MIQSGRSTGFTPKPFERLRVTSRLLKKAEIL
jgi:hypothetical protein